LIPFVFSLNKAIYVARRQITVRSKRAPSLDEFLEQAAFLLEDHPDHSFSLIFTTK
jgi:hypothetical protein